MLLIDDMQKVLVIGYVWPEPNSSAAGAHMMSILRVFVQQGWSVEFSTPAQPTDHMIDLAGEGITSRAIALNDDSFDTYILDYQPDIVLFDRFMMEEQFGWRIDQHCPDALKVLDTEDLQFLRGARQDAYKANRPMLPSDMMSDLAKREVAAILRCDLTLIISAVEMELLKDTFKIESELLCHLPFMVDLHAIPSKTLDFDARQHFMTIGNFRHAPNWDAVLYLQSLWPLIRKRLPKAELHIYGSYPPPKATALHHPKTGFLIKGWVSNASEVMGQARICLAPLRFGAGLKGKLLEAMLMQTPSITTSVGAEGMSMPLMSWPGVVTDDEDSFVEAAVALYSDKALWQEAQNNALAHVAHQFDGAELANALLTKIQRVQQNLVQHRLRNFTGAMLKHHTLSSTRYMSKWIMEKNKAIS